MTQDLDALIEKAKQQVDNYDCIGRQTGRPLLDAITALREENERLRKALNVAGGNIVNARYGLMTGDTKAKSAAYLGDAHARVQSALNPAGDK